MDLEQAIEKLESLGQKGFTISVCYGYSGVRGLMYSVDISEIDGGPFYANDFSHAIEIAKTEINKTNYKGV